MSPDDEKESAAVTTEEGEKEEVEEGEEEQEERQVTAPTEEVPLAPELLERVWASPEYQERLGAATRAALMIAQAQERAHQEAAAEEKRYADLSEIEDEDERTQKLAELGEETLKRRDAERTERAVRDKYVTGLWAELRQALPDLDKLTDSEKEQLAKAQTDGELFGTLVTVIAQRRSAAQLEGLKAQANQEAARRNREQAVSLPGARPGPASSADDIKHPELILSEAFNEAVEAWAEK